MPMQFSTDQQTIINLLNVVVADVTTFSGAVKRPENTEEPEVYTAGALRIIDPKHLRPFLAARQAVNRACLAMGTRFLSGYAVPDENLAQLLERLKEISVKMAEAKANLIGNYDNWIGEWADAHPAARNEILARAPKVAYADKQINFSLRAFKIQPQAEAVASVGCEDGIAVEIGGLAKQIVQEIAQDVRDSWSPDTEAASQRVRGLLKRVCSKARSLSFIDSRLGEIARFVETTAASLPTSGRIEGRDYLVLSGLLNLLVAPERLLTGPLAVDLPEEEPAAADQVSVEVAMPPARVVELDHQRKAREKAVSPRTPTVVTRAAYSW